MNYLVLILFFEILVCLFISLYAKNKHIKQIHTIFMAFIIGFFVALIVVVRTLSISQVMINGKRTERALITLNIMGENYDYYIE